MAHHVHADGLHLGRTSPDHQSEAADLDDALQLGPVRRELQAESGAREPRKWRSINYCGFNNPIRLA
jgi:hypothetical protein